MIGVDTSFLIDFFRGESNAINLMDKHKEEISISELVIYEFLCGNLSKKEGDSFLQFASRLPLIQFDRNATLWSAEVFRMAQKKGKAMAHGDAIVVGSYLASHVETIITRNKKHFQHISQIKVITY